MARTEERGKQFGKIQGQGLTRREAESEGEEQPGSGQSTVMRVPARRAAEGEDRVKGNPGALALATFSPVWGSGQCIRTTGRRCDAASSSVLLSRQTRHELGLGWHEE
jgi:hypothetical protein